ncbi:uncharacterized protein LOC116852481 [Odontomachus brunneus]|uniref:uncharacterized protein LOC116852481 n=1 Tax=Odontomachus brunneus TaxID=486640 RepID=UPI0013F26138|nr:uncharacterized protein LOC116852481 [Odontomachus brunneus]
MKSLFAGKEGVRIARPAKRAELRVRDLDDAVTAENVVAAMASFGGYGPGDVRTGTICAGANGLGTMWVQCPLASAKRILDGGCLRVGWAAVRVEALAWRPLQCYRCMQWGHVRPICTSGTDRSQVLCPPFLDPRRFWGTAGPAGGAHDEASP